MSNFGDRSHPAQLPVEMVYKPAPWLTGFRWLALKISAVWALGTAAMAVWYCHDADALAPLLVFSGFQLSFFYQLVAGE
jgi:hypothetical protein